MCETSIVTVRVANKDSATPLTCISIAGEQSRRERNDTDAPKGYEIDRLYFLFAVRVFWEIAQNLNSVRNRDREAVSL